MLLYEIDENIKETENQGYIYENKIKFCPYIKLIKI